jgi:hypothetical protein
MPGKGQPSDWLESWGFEAVPVFAFVNIASSWVGNSHYIVCPAEEGKYSCEGVLHQIRNHVQCSSFNPRHRII